MRSSVKIDLGMEKSMTIFNQTYTLANGVDIPKLGLGTWFIDDGDAADAVRAATDIGYRNIDTAQAYGNERGVGEGVRSSGVAREEMFVSTKLAAEIKDYENAVAAIDGSLATLDIEYIDGGDRKSTRLNSSHVAISYAVFCLKKKMRGNIRREVRA